VPQLDITNVNLSLLLLEILLCSYLYFLPPLLAFQRGHRQFWWILAASIVLSFVQPPLLQYLLPVDSAGLSLYKVLWISLLYSAGPGWFVLLFWALRSVASPDPRLIAFGASKTADVLAALPLVVWFGFSALNLRPGLVQDGGAIVAGSASLLVWLQLLSRLFSILFCLLCVWALLARDTAKKSIGGAVPRLCAVAGTFLGVGILGLPMAGLSLPLQTLALLLMAGGSAACILVLGKLGKSFSIVPEARRLVTTGPYAWARHPLYAAEIVILLGLMLQYRQPWAVLMGVAVIALQVTRSVFEERVLSEAFPEYAGYKTRVKRFGFI